MLSDISYEKQSSIRMSEESFPTNEQITESNEQAPNIQPDSPQNPSNQPTTENPASAPATSSSSTNLNNQKTSYLTQAYFKPLFGSAEAMKDLFEKEGFQCIHSIKLHDKYGFVRFRSVSEAQLFVNHFDKFDTGRATLTVQISPKTVVNHPPCKRVYLSGYDMRSVTERDIYFLCAPLGFVRHISFHHEYSFVDYDTIEDASNAVDLLNKQPMKGKLIAASFAKSAPPLDFSNLTIPLTDIIPGDHEFWTILSDRLQAH
ncbi:hypothetical protein TRFO_41629 [Tritrichomonas foetus]|uniref:RRM domain-containing protein n=1 Tax=Tritrichomonas foetus TaxID=1144522 RepID=A0A1J4KZL2_9EUKA|nr:hypothetical protein TRFO_41629 [Tritrichomonas foetus]|eukprot:OHT16691.1 hypothetical protein TRFO_41629 [Tritrichomonas foetus]